MVPCRDLWPTSRSNCCRARDHNSLNLFLYNYIHCDLDLWPVTYKIKKVYSLTGMVNMSAKFDEELHNGLVFIVFTRLFPCQLWPWPRKSIGSILAMVSTSAKFDEAHNGLLSIMFTSLLPCLLWPLPLTSKINRVHPLTMANTSVKFDKEALNGLVYHVHKLIIPPAMKLGGCTRIALSVCRRLVG